MRVKLFILTQSQYTDTGLTLHGAVKDEKGADWQEASHSMGQAEQSIQHVCRLAELKQVRDWEKRQVEFKPYYKTPVSENLGTHCREWPARKANAEVQTLVEANSKPLDIVLHTDGSVTMDRLVGGSRPNRVEGLCTKAAESTESRPLAWPWR